MWYPEIEIVFHFGTCFAQKENWSVISRIDGRGGKMYSFWAMYSLRMSFWSVPPTLLPRRAVLLGDREVHGQRDRRRRVDRHRRRDLAEVDAVEEHFHVAQRVDRDAALADLAARHVVVRVVAVERRQVERRREARLPVVEQVVEALVRLLRRAVAGELPHRPELAAIAGRVDAARVGVLPRPAEVALEIEAGLRVGPGERLDRRAGDGRPVLLPRRRLREGLVRRLVPAPAAGGDGRGHQRIFVAHDRK